MSDVKFKIGDRAVINEQFDALVPDRDSLIGNPGVVLNQVPGAPELMYFKPDDPNLAGFGEGGTWAVIEYELDKLED